MNYRLRIVNTAPFFWILIPGTISIVLGMLFLAIVSKTPLLIFLIFPLTIILFICAQTFFAETTQVKIENGKLLLFNRTFQIDEITAYYLDENVSMVAFGFKLQSGEVVKLTITISLKWKSVYQNFISDFKTAVKQENPSVKKLSFLEIQPRAGKFLKFTVYIGIPVVVIIDIVVIISLFTQHSLLSWHVLPVNLLLLSLIPYVKRSTDGKNLK